MIVVDTNVASELMKRSPASIVGDWVRATAADVFAAFADQVLPFDAAAA